MKRYIKSSYTYDPWKNADLSEWSDSDIELWNSIDWKARDYTPYQDTLDSFEGILTVYGMDDVETIPVTFVKEFYGNTIYPPKYVVDDDEFAEIAAEYRAAGHPIVSPSVDANTHTDNGVEYKIADRADTVELYDRLSR